MHVITHNFYIYGNMDFAAKTAAVKRMMYYAKALADKNHAVYLVNCCSNKFKRDDFEEIENNVFILKNIKPTHSIFKTLLFLKCLNNFSANNNGKNTFLIYPYSHFFLELFSVIYLIFFKKQKVYFELNEVKKHYLFLYKSISNTKLEANYKILVHWIRFVLIDNLMRFYSGLVCISTNIEIYGKSYNKNTLYVPILTDSEITFESSNKIYSKKDSFNIGFSGSIVPDKENLFEFIEVVRLASDNEYNLVVNLCGSISKKNFDLLLKGENKELLNYYGNLDEKELSNFLRQQDLLVLPRGYTLQNKYGFSTKLSDYLNHKKMVLITDISDNALYIKDGYNGFVVQPNNPQMMYEKLSYIIDNCEEIENKIVANAIKTSINEFDYRLYKFKLQNFLKPKL